MKSKYLKSSIKFFNIYKSNNLYLKNQQIDEKRMKISTKTGARRAWKEAKVG